MKCCLFLSRPAVGGSPFNLPAVLPGADDPAITPVEARPPPRAAAFVDQQAPLQVPALLGALCSPPPSPLAGIALPNPSAGRAHARDALNYRNTTLEITFNMV